MNLTRVEDKAKPGTKHDYMQWRTKLCCNRSTCLGEKESADLIVVGRGFFVAGLFLSRLSISALILPWVFTTVSFPGEGGGFFKYKGNDCR